MAKRYEVRIEFDSPEDLVLDMSQEDYEEFEASDDYQVIWDLFEDRINDWLSQWTTICWAAKCGEYEEEEED